MVKVTMNLNNTDVEHAAKLEKLLGVKNKACAVSEALGIAAIVVHEMSLGHNVVFTHNGEPISQLSVPKLKKKQLTLVQKSSK